MLVMWFTLEIFDYIHVKYFLDSFPKLGFGIITKKSIRGTNKVFKGVRHFVVGFHRENSSEVGGASTEGLDNSGATVTKNTVVLCRCIRKECISSQGFVEARNVSPQQSLLGLDFTQ